MEPISVVYVDGGRADAERTERSLSEAAGRLEVAAVSEPDGATSAIDRQDVDAVVVEHDPPNVDGVDVLERVDERDPDLPAVLLDREGGSAREAVEDTGAAHVRVGADTGLPLAGRVEQAIVAARLGDRLPPGDRRLERVASAGADMTEASRDEAVYERAMAAATRVIDFQSAVFCEVRDGVFEPVVSEGLPDDVERFGVDEGVLGVVYGGDDSRIDDDIREVEEARPVSGFFRSALTVPVGDRAVFQAASTQPEAFSETDRRLIELLVGHVRRALADAHGSQSPAE